VNSCRCRNRSVSTSHLVHVLHQGQPSVRGDVGGVHVVDMVRKRNLNICQQLAAKQKSVADQDRFRPRPAEPSSSVRWMEQVANRAIPKLTIKIVHEQLVEGSCPRPHPSCSARPDAVDRTCGRNRRNTPRHPANRPASRTRSSRLPFRPYRISSGPPSTRQDQPGNGPPPVPPASPARVR